jgi:hypothetical protein
MYIYLRYFIYNFVIMYKVITIVFYEIHSRYISKPRTKHPKITG